MVVPLLFQAWQSISQMPRCLGKVISDHDISAPLGMQIKPLRSLASVAPWTYHSSTKDLSQKPL